MTKDTAARSELKGKAKHELLEMLAIFLYLAFFFCALTTHSMLLLHEFHGKDWNYSFALINALVVTKVIMIGEYAKVGSRYESRPLVLSSIYKAFLFGLLVFAFHVVEEVVKGFLRGSTIAEAFHETHIDVFISRSIVIFCTFLPLFAFREFRRVLGEERFQTLLFKPGV